MKGTRHQQYVPPLASLAVGIIASMVVAMLCAPVSHAAVIISQFTFATDVSPTTQAANTTTTAMSAVGTTGSGRSTGFDGSYFLRDVSTTAGSSYIQFTITPEAGYTINLSSLSFDFASQADFARVTSFAPLVYTLDGGTTNSQLVGTAASLSGWIVTNGNNLTTVASRTTFASIDSTATFDLSALGPVTSDHGIRLRLWVTVNTLNNNIPRFDNFTVTGSVIPEPAAALLGSLGMLVLLRRRRA